jgi:septal ring factor EnvC (AmiA/AmiB activator)
MQTIGLLRDLLFSILAAPFDALVVERLRTLADEDKNIAEKVKATLEETHKQQKDDFVSIHDQLEGLEIKLKANARKIADENDEELEAELRATRAKLLADKAELETKKKRLDIIDSPEEIARLYRLLGNFELVWPTFDILQKQRAFSLLMHRIEVEVVSPHWLRLSIDWLDAICPRVDVAYVWRVTGTQGGKFLQNWNY